MSHQTTLGQSTPATPNVRSRVLDLLRRLLALRPLVHPTRSRERLARAYEQWARRSELRGDRAAGRYWAEHARAMRESLQLKNSG